MVEDDVLIAMFIEDTLTDLGYTMVGPAASVAEAEQLARTEDLDAAIVDLSIRGGNSLSVAHILEERSIPFVFSTGHDLQNLTEAGRVHPTLEKPYTSAEIANELATLLAKGS